MVNNTNGDNMYQAIIILLVLIIYILFFAKFKIEILVGKEAYINLYILKFIKIKKYRLNEDEIKEVKKKAEIVTKQEVKNYMKDIRITNLRLFLSYIKKYISLAKIDKLEFNLNVKIEDCILKVYAITIINTVIASLISKNIKNINTKNLKYNITSNEKNTKLNMECIIYSKITNSIIILIKIIYYTFKLKKRGNEAYGKGERTSNRKFNGNSNDIVRVND